MSDVEWLPDETFADYKRKKYAQTGKSLSQKNSERKSIGVCPNTNEKKHLCKCRTCINRRNRQKGRRKQNLARKALNIPSNRFHGADAHEENWQGALRIEVKSGKQVGPIATRFYKAKAQSDANIDGVVGINRKPFGMVAMPDDSVNGLFICELDQIFEIAKAILENFSDDTK